jgi:4'-phosphopantetheinyl transferase
MTDSVVENFSRFLPPSMKAEIGRYRNSEDRKARMLARLMLRQYLQEDGCTSLIQKWSVDKKRKPQIDGWDEFNISHSGDIVVFARSSATIGIDVEMHTVFGHKDHLAFFHPNEKEFISTSDNVEATFFEIWVKKEALLKALGVGLLEGLNGFDCRFSQVETNGQLMHYHEARIAAGYTCYVCSPIKDTVPVMKEFRLI